MMITALGRPLRDEQPFHPQALLERARRPGRSAGAGVTATRRCRRPAARRAAWSVPTPNWTFGVPGRPDSAPGPAGTATTNRPYRVGGGDGGASNSPPWSGYGALRI
jgi:hypothetical protein